MSGGADDGYFAHLDSIQELEEKVSRIRRLNDEARITGLWCLLVFSRGLHVLGSHAMREIRQIVADFDEFDQDNDVYEEHDFGAVDFGGHNIFWKIDCYDKSLSQASPNPADERLTTRVLTIMLAEEY